MIQKLLTTVLVGLMCLPGVLYADTAKGRIKYISKKASAIQIKSKPPVVVRFDQNTQFVNAKSIKELGDNELLEVEFEPGQPATKITKILFGLPPGVEIDLAQMEAIIKGDRPYLLVDARPGRRFPDSHLPTAISIFARELPKKLDLLPTDKSELLIFYCGGTTCPYTGESVKIVRKHGYTNVKGFQGGMPAWKKARKPVHATASWVAKNLDEHHVVIDVRPRNESSKRHIKTAVTMPAPEFTEMTRRFIKEKQKARLPGVSDKAAPILLYGNMDSGQDVLTAYKELMKWRYKNVAIIEGGFDDWVRNDRPSASGPAEDTIAYVRKLKEGAIPRAEFVKIEKERANVTLLDVRSNKEIATGTLRDALAIPLDDLEGSRDKLPKRGEIIAYCSNGIRSEMAYELLKKKGFQNVRFLNETLVIKPDGSYRIE